MKDERMMILQMISDGKVTADEGAKLLEAIGHAEKAAQKPSIFREIEWMMDNVLQDNSKKDDPSPRMITIPHDSTIVIKHDAGSLKLLASDNDELCIEGVSARNYKIQQDGNSFQIDAKRFGIGMTVRIPKLVRKLIVHSTLGKITTENLGDALDILEIKTHTGSITANMQTIHSGVYKFTSEVGKIHCYLSPDSTCHIKANVDMGNVSSNLALETIEKGTGLLNGKLNDGGAMVELSTHTGKIFVGTKTW
ncbi:MAG: hypothetical protein B6242_17370 [Anaerolineaceae bacterium 4572_78]|nr:MAG: hypothetical protein B6242_17370 [Anaerolineaceae bacterium 4572_78]